MSLQILYHQTQQYTLLKTKSELLLYTEVNEIKVSCIVKEKIFNILQYIHDDHDYFSDIIILNYLIKKAFWSM